MKWVPVIRETMSKEDVESVANQWDELAAYQENRLIWDREALPEMVHRLAALYRQVATEIRGKER